MLKHIFSRVDRDSFYRVNALTAAVAMAEKCDTLGDQVAVLHVADVMYNWLKGTNSLDKPEEEQS